MHARHRYRIAAGPGTIDPNLWLVHYKPADPQSRMPASQIPIPREVQAQIQMRAQLQQAGPLMRKEFMLVDQANWPKVEFGQQAMRGPQPYYNPMQPGRHILRNHRQPNASACQLSLNLANPLQAH